MKAVVLDYQSKHLTERSISEPRLSDASQALFRIREVGVCGTDRELGSFRLGYPPQGESFLVLGHEALGQVVEAGSAVTTLQPGDWVAPMIRRSCAPPCRFCAQGRRDLCISGGIRERGIFGLHGYFTEYAIDAAPDLMRVPPALVDWAVLIEPLSVVEKAIGAALRVHLGEPASALVLGVGPIGILAALALQARGMSVSVFSLEPDDHPRAKLLRDAGIEYLGSPAGCRADIVLEATGSPEATLAGLRSLAPLGVYVVLGASTARGEISFTDLIVNNQTVIGSVNASPQAFAWALEDLARFDRRILGRILRREPFAAFEKTILGPPADPPKLVHVIAED